MLFRTGRVREGDVTRQDLRKRRYVRHGEDMSVLLSSCQGLHNCNFSSMSHDNETRDFLAGGPAHLSI